MGDAGIVAANCVNEKSNNSQKNCATLKYEHIPSAVGFGGPSASKKHRTSSDVGTVTSFMLLSPVDKFPSTHINMAMNQ